MPFQMLEFILKDDYSWDNTEYNYLVKIYNVDDKQQTLSLIRDYIDFIKEHNDFYDDYLIDYVKKFISANFKEYSIIPLSDIATIDY